MEHVLIDNLKGGETLAQEVWDDKGALWLAKGTTYKISYLNKLCGLGIDYICIKKDTLVKNLTYKEEFNPEALKKECKILVQRQLKRYEKSGSINIYKFEKFVFTIMNQVMESTNVLENMYCIKNYNKYTYEHSVNVTVIGILISKQMSLSRHEIYETAMGCILHDLGKTEVPEAIINKPATLTKEEFMEIKKHPIDGYNIMKNNKYLSQKIKEIILTHHEKLDGSGYPLGILGDQISLGARICSVADVFDAMCSRRPYKTPVPFAKSIRVMRVSMNRQLDMKVCSVLESLLE